VVQDHYQELLRVSQQWRDLHNHIRALVSRIHSIVERNSNIKYTKKYIHNNGDKGEHGSGSPTGQVTDRSEFLGGTDLCRSG
jgi:hypothetical protein